MSKNRTAAKKTAWKNFSMYIRIKECIETTGNREFGRCCDCGSIKEFSELDAGHFIPGRGDSVLFVEDNVHIQCVSCNRVRLSKTNARSGISPGYLRYMLKRYGEKRVSELLELKYKIVKLTENDFREISKICLGKIKELK